MSAQPTLAAVAVELKSAEVEASLSAVSFACQLESMAAGAARARLEVLAHRIGLSADATAKVLDDCERRATLLREAHLILRKMIAQQPSDASATCA